jgi:3-hydroxybutyryl-CoA dehydratase
VCFYPGESVDRKSDSGGKKVMKEQTEQDLLTYDTVEIGTEFPPYVYPLSEDTVRGYVEATQDPHPLFQDAAYAKSKGYRTILAPPTTAAIYATRAHKQKRKLPPGGIHAKQMFRFLKPVYPGDTLTSYAKVVDKYIKKDRKYVTIEVETKNQQGETVVISRSAGIWPE